jgi:hypothetical protein
LKNKTKTKKNQFVIMHIIEKGLKEFLKKTDYRVHVYKVPACNQQINNYQIKVYYLKQV